MKIRREIEEDIEINWEEIYQRVKKDYDEWIQHNIDNNVNPLNCSFDYDELEELSETFSVNVEHYMEEYDDRDIYPDFIANSYVNEFVDFLKKMKGSYVTTDELTSYNGLGNMGYYHRIVRHGAQEFVRDGVNTNAMEGFWSHFRRMIVGCYHDISDKYMQRYIDEIVYRWNTRKMDESVRFAHMFEMSIGKFDYKQVKMVA